MLNTLSKIQRDWLKIKSEINRILADFDQDKKLVPSRLAQQFLISGEDHRHGLHLGVDPIAIARIVWRRFWDKKLEGGSTIEQQIVRTITARYELTLERKVREIILALLVSMRFDKRDLPAVYLWIAYYGWRMNGFSEACSRLGLSDRSMTSDEAAMLVARIKYPEPRIRQSRQQFLIRRRTDHLKMLRAKHLGRWNYRPMG